MSAANRPDVEMSAADHATAEELGHLFEEFNQLAEEFRSLAEIMRAKQREEGPDLQKWPQDKLKEYFVQQSGLIAKHEETTAVFNKIVSHCELTSWYHSYQQVTSTLEKFNNLFIG